MMNAMSKKHIIQLTICATAIAAFLLQFQLYRFYDKSADNQFITDWNWLSSVIMTPGGISLAITSFYSQFFVNPYIGVITMTSLYVAIICLLSKTISLRESSRHEIVLSTLPVVFLILSMESSYYSLRGHTAFLMIAATIYIYERHIKELAPVRHHIMSAITTASVYIIAGSASSILIIYILTDEILRKQVPTSSIVCSVLQLGIASAAVRMSIFTDLKEALTPAQYYNWPSSFFFQVYAWASVPLITTASFFVGKSADNKKKHIITTAIIASLILGIGGRIFPLVHNSKNYRLHHEAYLAENGKWDSIIELHQGSQEPVFLISYLNLALAKKGILIQELFKYNQMDIAELIGWQQTSSEGLHIKSTVYYHLGYLSAARQAAFELNILTPGAVNPQELIKLSAISRAMNLDALADKYEHKAKKAPI